MVIIQTGKLITLLYMEYLSLWFLRLSVLVDLFFFFAIILQIGHRIHIYLIKRRLASVFYRWSSKNNYYIIILVLPPPTIVSLGVWFLVVEGSSSWSGGFPLISQRLEGKCMFHFVYKNKWVLYFLIAICIMCFQKYILPLSSAPPVADLPI